MTHPRGILTPNLRLLEPERRTLAVLVLVEGVGAIGVGFLIAHFALGRVVAANATAAEVALALIVAGTFVGLRRSDAPAKAIGAGSQVAVFALSLGFLLGLLVGGTTVGRDENRVALLLAVTTVGFLVGAVLVAALLRQRRQHLELVAGAELFRQPWFMFTAAAALLAGTANLVTGSIPLLASDINSVRFAGTGGVLGQAWVWIIGAVEALVVVSLVRMVAVRRLVLREAVVASTGSMILVALAARSFIVIVALSILIALATLGRITVWRFAMLALLGVFALSFTGQLREHQGATRDSIISELERSMSIGPAIFASVLGEVPAVIPHQHGRFLLRDLRAAIPTHPFGQPQRGDVWVTTAIRNRDAAVTGGSPPTLAGGLYIDFGIAGLIAGAAVLGALLALLFGWARRERTVGALALYAYCSAYVALSVYSYISIKPAVLMACAVCFQAHILERGRMDHRALPTGTDK